MTTMASLGPFQIVGRNNNNNEQNKSSRYRLIRSPRFIKQLSDIRSAGRQEGLVSDSRLLVAKHPGNGPGQNYHRLVPVDSSLLLMMAAYPSPRSSSTTASNDNLHPAHLPSFISTQKVQQPPRPLLVVPSVTAQGVNPQFPNSTLAAISCLASPPWTRSTSPASTQSIPSSSYSPPNAVLSSSSHSSHSSHLCDATRSPALSPPELTRRIVLTPPVIKPHLAPSNHNNNNKINYSTSSSRLHFQEPSSVHVAAAASCNLQHNKSSTLTPCYLISTTTRRAPMRSRSMSMPSLVPFAANQDDDREPFTLIPLPDVDANELPEQSWAYRNIRKLVSRLAAHVKARRAASAPRTSSSSCVTTPTTTVDHEEDSIDENYEPPYVNEIKEELSTLSKLVREQFGGSLCSVLKQSDQRMSGSFRSYRYDSPPRRLSHTPRTTSGTLSSGRSVPIAQSFANSSQSRSSLNNAKLPPTTVTHSDFGASLPINRQVVLNWPTTCAEHSNRCPSCFLCDGSTGPSRYGLKGQHIHLPAEELDLNALYVSGANLAELDCDETDIPRSALSPLMGFADPVADDMFHRTVSRMGRHAVRF